MLIPIIKDFNNAFSYLVSNSVEKTKEMFDPVSKSLLHLSENQSDQYGSFNELLKISWTGIRICFLFLVQTIQYIVSFQWLRDFAYLPISIPNNMLRLNENNTFIQNLNNNIVSLVGDRQNVLQRFLFSNQTIAKPETGLAISEPYNNFILGLPSIIHNGAPVNSWSLSFLSNKWFDPLTVPVNFLSTGLESGSKNSFSLPEQITGNVSISNIILMSILICITTGFSSFINSFFISFPLSLSNLLSLRYLIIQKFWAGCVSVLGIVFGEIIFMLFLILPPPFIQVTLVYLESVWPYIIGLSLIIFIIFDLISNPYTNTMSIHQTNNQIASNTSPLAKQTSIFGGRKFLPIKLGNNTAKIFGFSFLLALTEQSCYFSFFGSLNLSSTGNFLDTYLFAASKSPIILFFSCTGFLIGSFLAIIIYNLIIAKAIFLIASLSIKMKQYNPDFVRNWLFNRKTNFGTSMDSSGSAFRSTSGLLASREDKIGEAMGQYPKNYWVFIFQIFRSIKNNIISRLRYLFFSVKSKDRFKSLLLALKNLIQLFLRYLPGGKRIVFFLFPGQAHSYKSDFQATSLNNNQAEETVTTSFPVGFKPEPKSSIETRIENMLRSNSLNMPSSFSPLIPKSSKDSSFTNNENAAQLGGSAFYNKIDKVLLTCLITLSFTTIPYYSFDYLINSFFGFIPQDQILNAHSLRVNFPDYTNLLGITLSDNNSVINTDVSLYDRAHFMYGEWPNSFESLNYQGELMWTNLRDHRRQKRTRRSTRLKFKTLKTKISTSWKEFKRSSGFSGSTSPSSFSEETKRNENFSNNSPTALSNSQINDRTLKDTTANSSNNGFANQNNIYEYNRNQAQKSLRSTNNLSNLFYKIFLAQNGKNDHNQSSGGNKEYLSKSLEPISQTKGVEIIPKIPEEIRRSTSLSETIKPLSTSTFIDLSGGEKYIKTYPKNWKRVITEKYYQNPIYQTVLSNDLKNFLKREPATQQLRNNQENELYFLRVKMAHYYDSLRFYFSLKEQINSTRPKLDGADSGFSVPFENSKGKINQNVSKRPAQASSDFKPTFERSQAPPVVSLQAEPEKIWNDKRKSNQSSVTQNSIISLSGSTKDASEFSQASPDVSSQAKRKDGTQLENMDAGVEESPLPSPPFQFKSMTSMNYRQQFKGTLKTVKQLFAISLPESVPAFSNAQYEQNPDSNRNYKVSSQRPNQSIDAFSKSTGEREPVEKSYKYDKYLFNEYAYPKNEFLHEEGRGFNNRKSNLRESPYQNSTGRKGNITSNEPVGSRGYRGIGLATKNIYNLFGSNDPFYVGWDQNLRKFVLTSRILSRSSALNYNVSNPKLNLDQNQKQKQLDFNNDNSIRGSSLSNLGSSPSLGVERNDRRNLTSQIKNRNNKEELNTSDVPIYSTNDIKRLEEKKRNFNQQSVHIYRPYTSWPFLKHQLKNLPNRPYFVLYENYLNILNKRIHLFRNININDIDTKSLTFLYSYSFNNNVKKYVSQLPINIYKQSMRPSSLENLFTPISNARSNFLWPGSTMPAWEYYFW